MAVSGLAIPVVGFSHLLSFDPRMFDRLSSEPNANGKSAQ
jgi:hypothetical protein